uniref:CBF1-interacting co-repressor CIR N-terminal domain-containing protein n=1 Tax=Nelumbo nucifera TaxID=4432 RepID=A0A822XRT6_NELNU|nr:TPA_asm: hypothetical protein HUJ06_025778 [Nelumbo nucifera]
MALKFLNKKGWHTGSLRNIENVWKAEQKHEAEQKKLEELRKQIQEERERSEFRVLQEQAGLVPKQERLDFLYESGLAVGKGSSDGFKALEVFPKSETDATSSSSKTCVPGALFEEKPQSANDAWRKLHSDPLLLIRQQEQEALARIKNNPIQMAMIRKSVEEVNKENKKHKEDKHTRKKHKKKHHFEKSKHGKHSLSNDQLRSNEKEEKIERSRNKRHEKNSPDGWSDSEADTREERGKKRHHKDSKHRDHSSKGQSDSEGFSSDGEETRKGGHSKSKHGKHPPEGGLVSKDAKEHTRNWRTSNHGRHNPIQRSDTNYTRSDASKTEPWQGSYRKNRQAAPKLSEEERALRLREMQMDAELYEEQRWKRLKKASEDDAREERQAGASGGRYFLDAAQKDVYGADKGGSFTIEESVRRRTYYLQRQSDVSERNAFRR